MRDASRSDGTHGQAQVLRLEEGARVRCAAVTLAKVESSIVSLGDALATLPGLNCPPKCPAEPAEGWVAVRRESLFVRGRYSKTARGVSQTAWRLEGQEGLYRSVEEVAADHLAPLFGAADSRLHGSGREDVDVRMLGGGRPFVLELKQPRISSVSQAAIDQAAMRINRSPEGVTVTELRLATTSDVDAVTAGAGDKRKEYAALVRCRAAVTPEFLRERLDAVKELAVCQTTPVRVLHRRSLMDRPKVIHGMRTRWVNAHWFVLRLVTSAGAYVKEFVHGDLGRTQPNVGALLGDEGGADILQLDVLNVLAPGEECFHGPMDALVPADEPAAAAERGWRLTDAGVWVRRAPAEP
ncbi:hypothetical protein FNF27_06246 [Cafeteria roenbergensis]|uniref:tRNA pseudouridine(55) synthase n=2 Tax=Cafeteria roenbergensis TaxID=33653 RepID=A0A5A8CYU0_CAFRO|nr:hypothetical protein FNF28_07093 [Cafeteria roenbergensis]KAA0157968.1 hypothetical protein FNF31_05608 [Cafeteria roenbergensis]KAA0171739.1 hypothetical protein FNF27_06246 [Cafeteria roenbergensis]